MQQVIRVLTIEDNTAYRQSLQDTIEAAPDMVLAGSFGRGEDAVEALKEDCSSLRPRVILLDLHLPGRDGISFIPVIKQLVPHAEIIVLTQDDNYLKTLEAIRLGVSGYLLKTVSINEIWNAIREVEQGGNVIDPRLSRLVLNVLTSGEAPDDNPLSERERQVLEQLAMGYAKKEIADNLQLSFHTVNRYSENLYKKLQVSNVAAAVATAIRKGLI
ncbi:DNA-binding response regulator [Coraliomargarita sinensis]|uniref:DNA-binding response regulator n=1 Tax=Coraliomargarita sinensis TaxID=2174842 RepID=A0A317ZNM3_9BACT|nr:response regulator transcription factor [Coraliomargarita sinensis]PXA05468.1 DNA-binding response regulator [Coraliomargarita sinensis]